MTAADFLPPRRTLPALRKAVQGCRGWDLSANATQAVFREGPARAEQVRACVPWLHAELGAVRPAALPPPGVREHREAS